MVPPKKLKYGKPRLGEYTFHFHTNHCHHHYNLIIDIHLIIDPGKCSHPTKDSRKWTRREDASAEVRIISSWVNILINKITISLT